MLSERLKDLNIEMAGFSCRSGVIFRINEAMDDFYISSLPGLKKRIASDRMALPQNMPFMNTLIEFIDGVSWVIESKVKFDDGEERSIIYCTTFGRDIGYMNYGQETASFAGIVMEKDNTLTPTNLSFVFDTTTGIGHDPFGESKECWENFFTKLAVLYRFTEILSCKNIRIVEKKATEQNGIRRKRPFTVKFYTLQIRSISDRYDENHSDGGGWVNSVHFVRGHKRTYTDEHPLFGKYSGSFWVPPHARGNKKIGVIYKDYMMP